MPVVGMPPCAMFGKSAEFKGRDVARAVYGVQLSLPGLESIQANEVCGEDVRRDCGITG